MSRRAQSPRTQSSEMNIPPAHPSTAESGDQLIEAIHSTTQQLAQHANDKLNEIRSQAKPHVDKIKQQVQPKLDRIFNQSETQQGINWLNRQENIAINMFNELLTQSNPAKRVLVYMLLLTNAAFPLLTITHNESRIILLCYTIVSLLSHFIYSRTNTIDYRMTIAHLPFILLLSYLSNNASYYTASESVSTTDHTVTVTVYMARSTVMTLLYRATMLVDSIVLLSDIRELVQQYLSSNNPQLRHHIDNTINAAQSSVRSAAKQTMSTISDTVEQVPLDTTTTQNKLDNTENVNDVLSDDQAVEPSVSRASLRNNRPSPQEPAGRLVEGVVVKGA